MKKLKIAIWVGIVVVFLWIVGVFLYISLKMGDTSPHNARVAIVLGAGTNDKEPSPVFRERLNHAILLYNNKKIQYIILTGGYGEGSNISDSQIARKYLLSKGIAPYRVFIEEKSTLTYTNLVYAQEIMQEKQFQTALIVSDPHHLPRAMAICKKLNIQAYPSPTQTSKYQSLGQKFWAIFYETVFFTGGLITGKLRL